MRNYKVTTGEMAEKGSNQYMVKGKQLLKGFADLGRKYRGCTICYHTIDTTVKQQNWEQRVKMKQGSLLGRG